MPVPKSRILRPNTTTRINRPQQYIAEPVSTRVKKPIIVERQRIDRSNDVPINSISVGSCAKNSIKGAFGYCLFNLPFRTYQAESNKGVNLYNARKIDVCLAKYAKGVAEEISTGGACYTGVKWAFLNAGVLNNYEDMPKGSAKDSLSYFNNNPDKFEKVNVKKEDLKNLPAGMIIVYTKEGKDGHIAITNGNGQEMSDCTDNMGWLDAKGKGATFTVYKLTDNWQYNDTTKKLEFIPPKK